MADSSVSITQGSGADVDSRTESTNGNHRQVVVLGDPAVNDSVAAVKSTDPSSNDQGIVVRDPNTTAIVSGLRDVRVQSVVDGTIQVGTVTRLDRVMNVVDGTLSTIGRVQNLVDGTVSLITRVDRVMNVVDGTLSTVSNVSTVASITNMTGLDRVRNVVDGTISTVTRVSNVVDGTLSLVNIQSTAVIAAAGGTVAGSTSGVSVSGVTLISPESSRNIKVYAISLTTTAQVHNQVRFTNGAGTSPTTFWQVGLQAPSQGISGVNLAVTPPGFLFACGSNTTLALLKDTGSLVHYAISYFKESA